MTDEEEPQQRCDNCKYSTMEGYFGYGQCDLRLPPWLNPLIRVFPREVHGSDSCSFHEPRDE